MKNLVFILLLILSTVNVYSQCTLTLQPGPQNGKDALVQGTICNTSPAPSFCDTSNTANWYSLRAGSWTHNGNLKEARSYLQFDLSSIDTCLISEAKLILHHDGGSEDHCGQYSSWHPCLKNEIELRRVTSSWDEHNVTWINQPSYTTDTTNLINNIYVNDSSATPFSKYKIDVTDIVNFWIANPDSNFGFLIKALQENTPYRRVRFASSDNSNQWRRPKLVLTLACDSTKCNNILAGKLFDDTDQNCLYSNSVDNNLEDWLVKIEPGPTYATTDQFGNWQANVDQGTYTITPINKNNNLWSDSCISSYTVTFNSKDTAVSNLDFPMNANSYCADLWVDIGVSRMRRCHQEWFKVVYCNKGNIAQDSVYVDVDFDNFIHPQGASIPYTTNADSTLRFDLGTLQPYECGYFLITTTIDCNVEFGTTQCANATIYPRNICEPIDSTWDKSSVAVEGQCLDSLVCFTIYNTGDVIDGDMAASSNWRLYENNVLVQTGSFQLNGQDSSVLCFAATGHTLRLEAEQRPGHPGNSHPRSTVENCNNDGSIGVVSSITVPEDDADSYTESVCDVILASYDPNEKVVKPTGITTNQYISAKDQLEYTIHFQNTGNAPALLVVIKDTLSSHLNPETVVSGVSSHDYKFKIEKGGILEWRFDGINLIDSATNEPESHGYVKFKVNQQPNNEKGTLIENRVGIYFDVNEAVVTEYAWNIVWDTTLTNEPVGAIKKHSTFDYMVYPNPAKSNLNFLFRSKNVYNIRLLNLMGQQLRPTYSANNKLQIPVGDLESGVYLFEITDETGNKSVGKFMKK